MLVLAYADDLGVELDEFGQRVHQAAADAHRPADGDVFVRKFLASDVGGGINRGAAFVDHHQWDGGGELEFFDEGLRLPRTSAVADGDGFNLKFFD